MSLLRIYGRRIGSADAQGQLADRSWNRSASRKLRRVSVSRPRPLLVRLATASRRWCCGQTEPAELSHDVSNSAHDVYLLVEVYEIYLDDQLTSSSMLPSQTAVSHWGPALVSRFRAVQVSGNSSASAQADKRLPVPKNSSGDDNAARMFER